MRVHDGGDAASTTSSSDADGDGCGAAPRRFCPWCSQAPDARHRDHELHAARAATAALAARNAQLEAAAADLRRRMSAAAGDATKAAKALGPLLRGKGGGVATLAWGGGAAGVEHRVAVMKAYAGLVGELRALQEEVEGGGGAVLRVCAPAAAAGGSPESVGAENGAESGDDVAAGESAALGTASVATQTGAGGLLAVEGAAKEDDAADAEDNDDAVSRPEGDSDGDYLLLSVDGDGDGDGGSGGDADGRGTRPRVSFSGDAAQRRPSTRAAEKKAEKGEGSVQAGTAFVRLRGLVMAKRIASKQKRQRRTGGGSESGEESGSGVATAAERPCSYERLREAVKAGQIKQCQRLPCDAHSLTPPFSPLTPPPAHHPLPAHRLLSTGGVDTCRVDRRSGRTLLHLAACGDHLAAAQGIGVLRVLASKAALSAVDKRGDTPLLLAVRRNRFAMAGALRQLGAGISVVDRRGLTPLLVAARSETFDRRGHACFLMLAGTEVALEARRPEDKATALHVAVEHDNCNLARVLTLPPQQGRTLSPHIVDGNGNSAFDLTLSKTYKRTTWCAILLQWGAPHDLLEERMGLDALAAALRRLQKARVVLPSARDFVRDRAHSALFSAARKLAAGGPAGAAAAAPAAASSPLLLRLLSKCKVPRMPADEDAGGGEGDGDGGGQESMCAAGDNDEGGEDDGGDGDGGDDVDDDEGNWPYRADGGSAEEEAGNRASLPERGVDVPAHADEFKGPTHGFG